MKILRTILAIIPWWIWLGLGLGILVRLASDDNRFVSNMILNCMFIFLFLRISIILHEIGHLMAAKIMGGKPKRMQFGTSHEAARFKLFNIRSGINSKPGGAYAMSSF